MSTAHRIELTAGSFFSSLPAAPFLLHYRQLAASDKKRLKIRDLQVMMLSGPAHLHAGEGGGRRRHLRASPRPMAPPALG